MLRDILNLTTPDTFPPTYIHLIIVANQRAQQVCVLEATPLAAVATPDLTLPSLLTMANYTA